MNNRWIETNNYMSNSETSVIEKDQSKSNTKMIILKCLSKLWQNLQFQNSISIQANSAH